MHIEFEKRNTRDNVADQTEIRKTMGLNSQPNKNNIYRIPDCFLDAIFNYYAHIFFENVWWFKSDVNRQSVISAKH